MTETRACSELLIDGGWKHRSFGEETQGRLVELAGPGVDWSLVSVARRESLFWTFRAAFLMGLSVEEALSRAFAETRSESTFKFGFGKNVEIDENLFDAYWTLWRLARAVSSFTELLAKHVWAFDSPESILANGEFQADAKMKWGDAVVDEFVSLASDSDSILRRNMFAAFYRSRVSAPRLKETIDFQTDARFSCVLAYIETYAQKKVSDVRLEYYYDMKARRVVARNPLKNEADSGLFTVATNKDGEFCGPPPRRSSPAVGMSKTLKRESVWVEATNVSAAAPAGKAPPEVKPESESERRPQVVFESKQQSTSPARKVTFEGPPPKNRGPVEGMSRTLKRESVWVEPPDENPVAAITFKPSRPRAKTELVNTEKPQSPPAPEPPVRGFLEWSQRADRLKRQAEEKRRLAEGIKTYEPIVRRKAPAEIALEVLRIAGLILVGVIVLPIAWILRQMFEPLFGEQEEEVPRKGDARLVDRVYLDKEHEIIADIYMKRD